MLDSLEHFAAGFADALVRGKWEAKQLVARTQLVIVKSRHRSWIAGLIQRIVDAFPGSVPPAISRLIRFIKSDPLLLQWQADGSESIPKIDLCRLPNHTMQPAHTAARMWKIRPLVTTDEVAVWLGLEVGELLWFADCQGRSAKLPAGPLRHYRYRWIEKMSGGQRLLEVPKTRLKSVQRKILDEILNHIPPHTTAHAYRRGRSIATYLAPHAGKRIVLHIDLKEFFPSVRASQIHALFRTAGYPERVASILCGLCTNTTPRPVFDMLENSDLAEQRWKRYGSPHLPQGAPTSPALANLAAFWLDCRLTGLARKVGADYTRYADDLVFSGGDELNRCLSRFRVLVAAIVLITLPLTWRLRPILRQIGTQG